MNSFLNGTFQSLDVVGKNAALTETRPIQARVIRLPKGCPWKEKFLDSEIETKETLFEKLKKARATGDPQGIKQARMEYLKALQILYTDVLHAGAEPMRLKS